MWKNTARIHQLPKQALDRLALDKLRLSGSVYSRRLPLIFKRSTAPQKRLGACQEIFFVFLGTYIHAPTTMLMGEILGSWKTRRRSSVERTKAISGGCVRKSDHKRLYLGFSFGGSSFVWVDKEENTAVVMSSTAYSSAAPMQRQVRTIWNTRS